MCRALTLVGLLLSSFSVEAQGGPTPTVEAEVLARRLGETTWGMEELLAGKVEQVTITLRVEELDGDGNVKHTQERVDRVTVKDGQHHREVLQASKDGQDATEALRKDLEERQRKGEVRTAFNSVNLPFAASHLAQHRFSLASPDPREPHRLRLRFEPRADDTRAPYVHKGEALVDPNSGQLVRLVYSPTELPDMADRVDVRMDFRAQPGVGQVLDTLHVDAEGGFLFYRKHLRITARYSNLVPAKAQASR
ncbi:hypothetical protein ATI61_106507 [Archangium gephyra]|uniref:Uncharacterized protein n=1 Tax=Archangium gephyra TaxID=48 RepID=A0AAC8TAN7_9BACT|nr:hypothetical protein [Archangium gephyra]AKI99129.1 Hypothetical protein AA314_00756 [Archangium gephyra]REG31037.1 hypothetical protein ATI61_106507 [Archangium gephyra]